MLIGTHHPCITPSRGFTQKLPFNPHEFSFSTAPNITRTLPFNQVLAASSPHCNFDFSQNPILRLYHGSPFAPVQSLKAVLVMNRFNFYIKHACTEL